MLFTFCVTGVTQVVDNSIVILENKNYSLKAYIVLNLHISR